jgi:hypothetical protein
VLFGGHLPLASPQMAYFYCPLFFWRSSLASAWPLDFAWLPFVLHSSLRHFYFVWLLFGVHSVPLFARMLDYLTMPYNGPASVDFYRV